jgi:hypothetical protein
MSKLRWAKFFWADWAGDNALSLCSLAAQGLWMRLLCIAAQNEPYGSILSGGRQPPDEELAKLMRPAIRVERFRRLLAELELRKVVKRDPDGTLFSARMRADLTQSVQQSDNGRKSWKARQNNEMKGARFEPDKQNTHIRFKPEAEAEEEEESPPVGPPLGGARGRGSENGRGRKKAAPPSTFKNGMAESAAADLQRTIDNDATDTRARGAAVVPIARHLNRRFNQ